MPYPGDNYSPQILLAMNKTRGVLLGLFGGGVPLASSNPYPISDQKMPFSTPVFRPDLVRD